MLELVKLLPLRSAVVMVGKNAARARYLETTLLPLFTSDHPSPIVRARFPERWKVIPAQWERSANSSGKRARHARSDSPECLFDRRPPPSLRHSVALPSTGGQSV